MIISFTHTIVAAASASHFKEGIAADPSLASAPVYHPPGTVLDLPEDEAQHLIEIGTAVEWIPEEHGDSPRTILAVINRNRGGMQQQSGVRHV